MQQLGYRSFILAGHSAPPVLKRIEAAFKSIYRPQDIAVGGHIGVFMFRDIFARIAIPRAYGVVSLNPLNFIELTPIQRYIMQSESETYETFIDQFSDVGDIQYGTEELKLPYSTMALVKRFIDLSRLHLHAAAAVLTGGYEHRGAVQSVLLASELALKSGAAAQGLSEEEIK